MRHGLEYVLDARPLSGLPPSMAVDDVPAVSRAVAAPRLVCRADARLSDAIRVAGHARAGVGVRPRHRSATGPARSRSHGDSLLASVQRPTRVTAAEQ